MNDLDILRLIAARSPAASSLATLAIRGDVRLRALRASIAAARALADPQAAWTTEERERIATLLAPDDDRDVPRTKWIQVRVSPEEHAEIEERAAAARLSISEYIRQRALAD
ncbi:MAG: hypothetical protein KatS3mg060_1146 [Dehalococcoidia bacterium]|nr:MAG: hypothetical protein KatS3mg060_1146 [Dehalococcoidia bacterium]